MKVTCYFSYLVNDFSPDDDSLINSRSNNNSLIPNNGYSGNFHIKLIIPF